MTTAPRLGDAFTGSHTFETGERSALANVLGCQIGAVDVAPLGDLSDRSYRCRLAAAVASAAQPQAVHDALAGRSLADIVPAATHLAGVSIDADTCPANLFAALRDHDVLQWRTVLGLRLGDLVRLPGVGRSGAARLLGLALERGLAGLLDHDSVDADRRTGHDVALLLDHDDRLPALLRTLAADGQPTAVRDAAARLLLGHASPSTPSLSVAARRAAIDDLVRAAGDARDQAVFVSCEIGAPGSPTAEQLSRTLKIGRERLRQLRIRAAERVLAAATDAPEWLLRLVSELRSRVGVAAPADDVAAAIAELRDVGTATAGPLLSWLAGPYRTVRACPSWVATEPDRLIAATRSALDADGGVRLGAELNDVLAGLGVVAAHRAGWLRACGGVLVDGMVASTAGGPAAVLERVLFAAGRSLSAR